MIICLHGGYTNSYSLYNGTALLTLFHEPHLHLEGQLEQALYLSLFLWCSQTCTFSNLHLHTQKWFYLDEEKLSSLGLAL